jgi:predicted RNA-binding protein YlxR (DUF448 family)
MLKMPIRTCIVCRDKREQFTLNRLQCIDKQLQKFSGFGRSFYLCDNCLVDEKKLEKSIYRYCKNKNDYIVQLKEILANGR